MNTIVLDSAASAAAVVDTAAGCVPVTCRIGGCVEPGDIALQAALGLTAAAFPAVGDQFAC